MRKIKKEKMQKALKEIVTDYRIKTKNIIKWYEYNMAYPDTPEEEKPEDIPDAMEIQNMMEDMTTEMEEEKIDLATTGLSEDEQALDRYEGFPRFYYKHNFTLTVTAFDEKTTAELECFAYIMTEGREVGLPTPYYLATCIQGYKDFGFDTRILKRTVERMRKILWKRKNSK